LQIKDKTDIGLPLKGWGEKDIFSGLRSDIYCLNQNLQENRRQIKILVQKSISVSLWQTIH